MYKYIYIHVYGIYMCDFTLRRTRKCLLRAARMAVSAIYIYSVIYV